VAGRGLGTAFHRVELPEGTQPPVGPRTEDAIGGNGLVLAGRAWDSLTIEACL